MAVNRSSGGGSHPTSRERNSSSGSSRSAERRGGGLNLSGPVGNSGGYEGRPGADLTVEQMVSDLIEVKAGDKVDFVCDYYDYDGVFINNYFFGEQMTVSSKPEIKNYKIPGELSVCYRLEDYYGKHYWMPLID